jgi:hypothetical protein
MNWFTFGAQIVTATATNVSSLRYVHARVFRSLPNGFLPV